MTDDTAAMLQALDGAEAASNDIEGPNALRFACGECHGGDVHQAGCPHYRGDKRIAALPGPALLRALAELANAAEAHCALQDSATDERVGLTQPITVAEGKALYEARNVAFAVLAECATVLLKEGP